MYRHGPTRRAQHGFTLIELIAALVLLGIVASVGASLISDNSRTVSMVASRQTTSDRMRYAMDRMAREMREVKYDSTTGYQISTMDASTLVFVRTIGGSDVTVTITRPNGSSNVTLGYSTPAVTSTLINQLSGFTFQYLDIDGQATTSLTNVRFVVVSISVLDATSGSLVSERMRIALRNA
jgi:prepilin-type N-terminal cleavage/methylation domain-containing protein